MEGGDEQTGGEGGEEKLKEEILLSSLDGLGVALLQVQSSSQPICALCVVLCLLAFTPTHGQRETYSQIRLMVLPWD